MKKTVFLASIVLVLFSCNSTKDSLQTNQPKTAINTILNKWHKDVAQFNYDAYFNAMTDNAVFVGTDATEVWSKTAFQNFSKPFFDKKQTWNFKPISRNVYFDTSNQIAWFDELLDTWMGVCRGSGVLVYQDKQWKIQHYVLSVAVPNENMNEVVAIKKERDSLFIKAIND